MLPSPDVLAEAPATDFIGGAHHQLILVEWGPANSATRVDDANGSRLPVVITRRISTPTATVLSGQTVSDAIDCRGLDPVQIEVPSTFDGTTITFQGSSDNVTFQPIYDLTNIQVSLTATASRNYPLWGELAGYNYIKLVCGTAQTGDTVFKVQLRS